MKKLIIPWPYVDTVIALSLCVVGALFCFIYYFLGSNHRGSLFFGGISTLFAVIYARQLYTDPATAEIDGTRRTVTLLFRRFIFQRQQRSYSLSLFRSVRSRSSTGKNPSIMLELVSATDNKTLIIAEHRLGSYGETEEIQELRKLISGHYGLADDGFVGSR